MGYVTLNEFGKLDVRVGKVVKAEKIPGMKRILRLEVDIGQEKVRQMIAGGAEIYPPEFFVGRTVVVLTNLEPKKIAGTKSEGMLLAADYQGKPYWLTVEGEVPAGTKVR